METSISIKSRSGRVINVPINAPETLKSAIDQFGEDGVLYLAREEYIRRLRNYVGKLLDKGLEDEEVLEKLKWWMPLKRGMATIIRRSVKLTKEVTNEDICL